MESDFLIEQLKQVLRHLSVDLKAQTLSRCLKCNAPLMKTEKHRVKDLVPPYVYKTHERFSTCSQCGNIYWAGTHLTKIRSELEKLNK